MRAAVLVGVILCTILVFFYMIGLPLLFIGTTLICFSRESRNTKLLWAVVPFAAMGMFWGVISFATLLFKN